MKLGKNIALLLLAGLCQSHAQSNEKKPNIVWIVAEDMSPDLACYGSKVVKTPYIDKLASKGMKFTQAHVTAPACSPSRTSLATGVFQTTLGAHHMRYSKELKPKLLEGIRTLPDLLQQEGYNTGNVRSVKGLGTGKDDWQFKAPSSWDAKKWDELTKKQPFFCQINLGNTHRAFSKYSNSKIKESNITLPPYYPNTRILREDWACYLNDVQKVDSQVGKILQAIKEKGLSENTIVVFLSDHGRPMLRGKNWLYDSGTRIPLIVYIPKNLDQPALYSASTSSEQLLSTIDLVAETASIAGVKTPEWMQGRTFLTKGSKAREYIFTAIDRVGGVDTRSRAIRSKKFKYIHNLKRPGSVMSCSTAYRKSNHPAYHVLNLLDQKGELNALQKQLVTRMPAEELYDLVNDPFETNNLIGKDDYKQVYNELQGELQKWLKTSKDKGLSEDSRQLKQHFINYKKSTDKLKKAAVEHMENKVKKSLESRK